VLFKVIECKHTYKNTKTAENKQGIQGSGSDPNNDRQRNIVCVDLFEIPENSLTKHQIITLE